MCISRFRGIWKSGYKKIDLIIITLPEGNTKHTNKDRRSLRITLCAHSLPDHGQHHAYNCPWNIFASLQREPNFTLAVGEISQLWLFQFHTSSISHCAGTRSSQMHGAQRTVETRLLMSGLCPFESFAWAGTLPGVPLVTLPKQNANLQDEDVVLWSAMSKGHVKGIHIAFCSDKCFHNS